MPTLVSIRTAHAVVNVNTERKLPATVVTIGERGTSKEIGEIARSGLEAAGYQWPRTRINVHIEPGPRVAGDRPLSHATFALAVAIGVLVLQDELNIKAMQDVVFHADMGLNGSLRPVRDVFGAVGAASGDHAAAVVLARSEATDTALRYVASTRKVFLAWDLASLVDLLKERVPNATGKREGELTWPALVYDGGSHPVFLPLGTSVCLVSDAMSFINPQPTLHRILRGLAAYSSDGVDPTEPLELIRVLDWHGLPLPEPKQISRPLRAPHHTVSLRSFEGEVELAVGGVLYLEHVELLTAPVLRELRKPHERCVLVTQVDNWTQAAVVRRHLPPNTIFLESL